jgi:hypothetical protein
MNSIINKIIAAYLGNPYLNKSRILQRKISDEIYDKLKKDNFRSHLRSLIKSEDDIMIIQFLLSLGHWSVLKIDHKKYKLPLDFIPREYLEHQDIFPYIEKCNGLCDSAKRVFGKLDQVVGISEDIQKVKYETWSACFGKTLYESYCFPKLVRQHNILFMGESGTGKELFSQAALSGDFGQSNFKQGPAISVNLAALNNQTIESELFGHVKGSFTGATSNRAGAIQSAHKGSIFLDELGDIPKRTQVKILRAIESKKIKSVGSDKEVVANPRYISATNQNVEDEALFRPELLQRVSGSKIVIPPLRYHRKDIKYIGDYFLNDLKGGENTEFLDEDEYDHFTDQLSLMRYDWPGNVRELLNQLRAFLLGLPTILNVGSQTFVGKNEPLQYTIPNEIITNSWTINEVQNWYFNKVFQQSNRNFTQAAKILGVNRTTVTRKVK